MSRLPAAIFVVDVISEHIAVKEAKKLNIPVFAMVDTNSDPRPIDYVIPSNDDASKSIDMILSIVSDAIKDGLANKDQYTDVIEGETEEPIEDAVVEKVELSEEEVEKLKAVKEAKKLQEEEEKKAKVKAAKK
jgi:small subunit ribosomal protein S2